QGLETETISIARAAKDIDVPETTLRSTLEGRYPRSEEYWRKLKNYCQTSLDWLICGAGECPSLDRAAGVRDRILVIEDDLDRLGLIRLALKGFRLEVTRTWDEAAEMLACDTFDLILAGGALDEEAEVLDLLRRRPVRPSLILLTEKPPSLKPLFTDLADRIISEPLLRDRIASLVKECLSEPPPTNSG
ncbi:MAG: hypothetical protein JRC92_07765, partial [Deltaproteobacteria bacterium]|nr:hypothetical protein [Deltaproteobacteria bacterium]